MYNTKINKRYYMDEQIISRVELVELFRQNKIEDTPSGWLMDKFIIEIFALHAIEPKYLQDITKADYYKIVKKVRVRK